MDRFEDAYDAFIELGDYSDSADMAQACLNEPVYRDTLALYEDEKYEDAKKAFDDLGDYRDSESYSESCEDYLTSKMDESISMDKADAAFSGEFEKSDGEESVSISLKDDNHISFQFRESGQRDSARASRNTATYEADGEYTITFDVAGDTMAVTVSGEGGDQSPLNGIYYRVMKEADTMTIKTDANIRKDANETSDVVGVVNAGTKVKKIGLDDD